MLRLASSRRLQRALSTSNCPLCLSLSLTRSSSSSSTSSSTSRPSTLPSPSLDLSRLLTSPDQVKQNLLNRNFPLLPSVVDELVSLHGEGKRMKGEVERLRERRNLVAKLGAEGREEGKEVKRLLKVLEPELGEVEGKVQKLALLLPNESHPASPIGGEEEAITVATYGPPIPSPPPAPIPSRDHLTINANSTEPFADFPSSTLTTGPSWPFLLNSGALLELALTQYAYSIALSSGFTPTLTPDVIRADIAERCGFHPRDQSDAQQTYHLSDGTGTPEGELGLVLAGTAEVPLVASCASRVFSAAELPLRQVALGRAFRAEAGARGSEARGLYRVHQFSKVEMVVVCAEEQSEAMLQELRGVQVRILEGLGLSLRVLEMPTQELGASAHRKYDIEAWMPGRGKWGELSSASNCTDYQSRRLGIRYRPSSSSSSSPSSSSKTLHAHTLNATAAAIPRLIVALVENGAVLSKEGGKVEGMRLPSCLRRFWLGDEGQQKRAGIVWVESGEALRVDEE